MNNKGFTLIELLATLILLALVLGLSVGAFNFNFGKAKEKTEEVFVDSLRDVVDMYLSSEFNSLKLGEECSNTISKKHNSYVKVFKVTKGGVNIMFQDVINSSYKPLAESDFVNPANEDVDCNVNAVINVYRDEDYVYYYYINKRDMNCLLNHSNGSGSKKVKEEKNGVKTYYDDFITNLPKVDTDGNGVINDEDGYFTCG